MVGSDAEQFAVGMDIEVEFGVDLDRFRASGVNLGMGRESIGTDAREDGEGLEGGDLSAVDPIEPTVIEFGLGSEAEAPFALSEHDAEEEGGVGFA